MSEQRTMFDNIGGKLVTIGSRFPVVNGLLNAIRRKKNKVRATHRLAASHRHDDAQIGLNRSLCTGIHSSLTQGLAVQGLAVFPYDGMLY